MQDPLEKKTVHTILLVEPDPEVRATINSMLTSKGYAVYTAESHKKALAMLNTMPFSALLCCSSPRRMTCEEFAQEVKAYQFSLPVIVTTSINENPRLDKSEAVDKVLNKPLTIDEIHEAIQELVN
jgi:CheY-like chemotaxis protein